MARRRRGSRRASLVEDLLGLPWQFSVGLGVAVFIFLKGVFPAMAGGNMFLQPLAAAISGFAWLFSGIFFVIAAVVFAKEKAAREKKRVIEPTIRATPYRETIRQEPAGSPARGATHAERQSSPDVFDVLRSEDRQTADNAKPRPTEWSLELILDLEWKRFEDVCQQFPSLARRWLV